MSGKKNIKDFGKIFSYLKDPVLRKKEMGEAQLVVERAEFSGVQFQGEEWRNVRFINCNFVGAHQIKQALITQSSFEDCKFAGIFNLGMLKKVLFLRCLIDGSSHVVGDTGSLDVTFESCEQIGSDPEPNHWGSFGCYGEAAFIKCKAKWTNVTGETKHLIRDCDFEDVDCGVSKDGGGSTVLIENSRLLGDFDMRPATLLSLTIRDSTIGKLDLGNATVKGDILMERVKGGNIQAGIKEGAGAFTLRDSQIMGNGDRVCNVYAGAFQQVLIENVIFGSVEGQPVGIGGGYEPDDKNPQPVLTESVTFKNVKARSLRSARLNARLLRLENVEVSDANFKEGRIEALEFDGARFAFSLDLTGTQVKEIKQTGGTDIKGLGRALKLDGSNIKLPK